MLISINTPNRILKTANGAPFDVLLKYALIEEVLKS